MLRIKYPQSVKFLYQSLPIKTHSRRHSSPGHLRCGNGVKHYHQGLCVSIAHLVRKLLVEKNETNLPRNTTISGALIAPSYPGETSTTLFEKPLNTFRILVPEFNCRKWDVTAAAVAAAAATKEVGEKESVESRRKFEVIENHAMVAIVTTKKAGGSAGNPCLSRSVFPSWILHNYDN